MIDRGHSVNKLTAVDLNIGVVAAAVTCDYKVIAANQLTAVDDKRCKVARLGFAVGCAELIFDLNTLRNSINPYNVNNATVAYGLGSLADDDAFRANCAAIEKTRAFTVEGLRKLGFEMPESFANFVFARTSKMEGGEVYRALKERGILVRHFDAERICDYNRISIGTPEQMQTLLDTLSELLG